MNKTETTSRASKDNWGRVKHATMSMTDYDARAAQVSSNSQDPLGTPNNPSSEIFTVANVITFCRFLLTIAFLVLFAGSSDRYFALSLYALAAITDFLDGWVARSTQTVSWLGKIMDPIMDRFLLFTGVLGLLARGEVPLWIPCFVIGRDVVLFVGSVILQKYRRRPIDVAFIGKITTTLLLVGFCLCLLALPQIPGLGITSASWLPVLNGQGGALGLLFVYAGVICSAATAIYYYAEGIAVIRKVKRGEC